MLRAKRNTWLNWRGSTLPLPSAFALLAVPARLGYWNRSHLEELLQRRLNAASPPFLGWAALSRYGTLELVSRALNRRPETVRLGAEVKRWWPPVLRPLLLSVDSTKFERLRFCRACLERGDHSPLFQLPWWDGCPIHAEPLYEGCPHCDAPIPAGLPHADPRKWLACPNCAAELSDREKLVHLHKNPTRRDDDRWWQAIAAYRRWLRASQQARWALPWSVQGEGSFVDVARLAVQHLVTAVPVPSELSGHVRGATPATAVSRAWSRTFMERLKHQRVRELGFDSAQAMLEAGRHFYGALPITEQCQRALAASLRRLRCQLKVRVIGHGSPNAAPGAVEYDWRGPRPLAVTGFRLLTGLVQSDRVDGVAYLDFRAVELLLEPPVNLAQKVLARLTGLDLRDLRAWPRDTTILLDMPIWILSARRLDPKVRRERVPRAALRWLYERLILEAWHDLALECFARAKPGGVMAWTLGWELGVRSDKPRKVFSPIAVEAEPAEMHHPLLVHARADRQRPRGWAVAVLRSYAKGKETYIALLGRAKPQPFSPPCVSSFQAHWRWPEEVCPGSKP